MADTTLILGKKLLTAAFLEYADWDGSGYAPYAVTLGTKAEANPTDLIARPALTFPALAVQVEWQLGNRYGFQQEYRFTVRVSILYHWAAGEQPETELEDVTARVIDNIRCSKDVEDVWVGLDWVVEILPPMPQPSNNSLDAFVRGMGTDQAADGGGFCASVTDFAVLTFGVPVAD